VENFSEIHMDATLEIPMMVFVSIVAFVVLLTGLILIHEWGHFIAARMSGVVVEEFGFGLPPRVKRFFCWKGTDFTLNWIPFGGFVRLKGEGALDPKERRAPGSFAKAGAFARCCILLAGVFMNFLLAFCIFFFGFLFGRWVPTYLSLDAMEAAAERGEIALQLGVFIDDILEDGAAAEAGVLAQSFLIAIDGISVVRPEDVVRLQEAKRRVVYTVLEGKVKKERDITVTVDEGKTGVLLRTVPRELSAPYRDPVTAVRFAFRESLVILEQTIRGIGYLFSTLVHTGTVPPEISGPVGIAKLTYAYVQQGVGTYLRFVALLSLSLAAFNVLPFPALDGGRLLFVLVELVRGKPTDRRTELLINNLGFVTLLGLIFLVTFYDVLRLFIAS